MKRTVVLLHPYAGAGTILLFSQLFLAGCSGGDAGPMPAGPHGLDQSEIIALKKAAKSPAEFKDALLKRKMAQLQERGADVKILTSGKKTKRPH